MQALFLIGCAAMALVELTAPARAQPVPLPPPPAFAGNAGLEIGDFALNGQFDAGLRATSNIRQDPSEDSDVEYRLLAAAGLRSNWQQHALALTGSYVRHQGLKVEEQLSTALSGSVSGRYDFSQAWNLTLGVKQDESIVGRDNPLQFIGNLNGTTSIRTAEGALGWKGEQYYANLLGRFYEVKNETEIDVVDVSRLQAQDTQEIDVTVETGRNYGWGTAYALGGITGIAYTGTENVLPEDRDSFGFRLGLGVEGQRGNWTGQARIIGIFQDFDNPMIGKNINVVGRVLAMYQATAKLGIGIIAQRQFDGQRVDLFPLGRQHRLLRQVQFLPFVVDQPFEDRMEHPRPDAGASAHHVERAGGDDVLDRDGDHRAVIGKGGRGKQASGGEGRRDAARGHGAGRGNGHLNSWCLVCHMRWRPTHPCVPRGPRQRHPERQRQR